MEHLKFGNMTWCYIWGILIKIDFVITNFTQFRYFCTYQLSGNLTVFAHITSPKSNPVFSYITSPEIKPCFYTKLFPARICTWHVLKNMTKFMMSLTSHTAMKELNERLNGCYIKPFIISIWCKISISIHTINI